jgi:hypothetical protein
MKKITCEICGNNDLIKKDDVFVCEYCGTKYSLEEAKKMMIEGTVKIDNSDKVENLYVLARRARDDNNSESASKYYDLILQEHPQSWEAAFYTVYFSAMQSSIANIPTEMNRVSNCSLTVLKLIKETVVDKDEQQNAITEVINRVITISSIFVTASSNHFKNYSVNGIGNQEYVDRMTTCFYALYNVGDQLIALFEEKYAIDFALSLWRIAISYHNIVITLIVEKEDNRKIVSTYAQKIAKYDPDYKPEPIQKSGGCYIATSVYGSYDCPQVWTLRRYRDTTLASTIFGRAFIRTYYAISPTLVNLFGQTKWFSCFWKGVLDLFVRKFNESGVEDIRYQDRQW